MQPHSLQLLAPSCSNGPPRQLVTDSSNSGTSSSGGEYPWLKERTGSPISGLELVIEKVSRGDQELHGLISGPIVKIAEGSRILQGLQGPISGSLLVNEKSSWLPGLSSFV